MRLVCYHGFIDGIGGFIRKDASRQTGNDLSCTHVMRCLQHVVVDGNVVSLEATKHFLNQPRLILNSVKGYQQCE